MGIQNEETVSLFQITHELRGDFKHELPASIGFFSLEMPMRGQLRKLGKGPEFAAAGPPILLKSEQLRVNLFLIY